MNTLSLSSNLCFQFFYRPAVIILGRPEKGKEDISPLNVGSIFSKLTYYPSCILNLIDTTSRVRGPKLEFLTLLNNYSSYRYKTFRHNES